jgi:cell division protein FtsI (penicillin-binding protein 3)
MVPTAIRMQPDPVETIATIEGTVPDVRGLSGREAARRLSRLGLWPQVVGDGFVTAQTPAPGTPIAAGMVCRLSLDRTQERRTSPP